MRSVVVTKEGSLEYVEMPVPVPGPNDVLLRVQCVALNHLDLWVRNGVPGHRFPLPLVPGGDMAGIVEAVGEAVAAFQPGDRVALSPGYADPFEEAAIAGNDHLSPTYGVFGETRDGGCAELAAVPARNLLRMPAGMSFEEAAAFPLTFLTAWGLLARRAGLRPGEDVLIHAAGSGVSVACLGIAKLFRANQVFVTASCSEKLEKAAALGADVTINYKEQSFRREILRHTRGEGVHVVVDHVGPDTLPDSLRCLRRGGRLVTCGSTSGGSAEINMRLIFFKQLSILGSMMAPLGDMLQVWEHFCAGRLRPTVHSVFPVRDLSAAYDLLESRQAFGKIVIDVREW